MSTKGLSSVNLTLPGKKQTESEVWRYFCIGFQISKWKGMHCVLEQLLVDMFVSVLFFMLVTLFTAAIAT